MQYYPVYCKLWASFLLHSHLFYANGMILNYLLHLPGVQAFFTLPFHVTDSRLPRSPANNYHSPIAALIYSLFVQLSVFQSVAQEVKAASGLEIPFSFRTGYSAVRGQCTVRLVAAASTHGVDVKNHNKN